MRGKANGGDEAVVSQGGIRDTPLQQSRVGPWGKLEYFYTFLEPPSDYFKRLQIAPPGWVFPAALESEFVRIVRESDLDNDLMVDILEFTPREAVANGMMRLSPAEGTLEALTTEFRRQIYDFLLDTEEGRFRNQFFSIERNSFRASAEGIDLSEATIERIERFCVRLFDRTILTEPELVLRDLNEEGERVRVLQSIFRTRTILARLKIDDDSQLRRVADYWSAGPNRSRALPILQSISATGGISALDLIHLLPPVPRRLLYTYAQSRDFISKSGPDCYWAAMNFFSPTQTSRHLDAYPKQFYLSEDFERVKRKNDVKFGDVRILFDPKEARFIHAFVHIADDIVYTKNGNSRLFPFVLMKLDDLMSRYADHKRYRIDVFRSRN